MTATKWTARMLLLVMAFVLCGAPQMLRAQAAQDQSTPAQAQQPQTPPSSTPGIVDPSKGPLQPVPSSPETPAATGDQQQQPAAPSAPAQQQQQQQPVGTAVGQAGVTTGGAASKPAGAAIAPAKQHQTRSLLLKIGAVGAAAVAVGTVVALSKGSPSKPPGAR